MAGDDFGDEKERGEDKADSGELGKSQKKKLQWLKGMVVRQNSRVKTKRSDILSII